MSIAVAFVLIAIISYLIGTINFSKIIAWNARRKDITKVGSGNPGTMNMLRSFGFKLALFTLIAEVIKSGLTALIVKIVMDHTLGYGEVAYWFSGLFLMLGNDFPVWSKFKGGKGVACFVGIFLFSQIGWVGLIWLILCATAFYFIEYGSVASFMFITGMAIAYTIYIWVFALFPYSWAVTAIIWFLVALTFAKHHANIYRLFHKCENKIDFKQKLKECFCHKKGEEIISEDQVETKPEQEIVIEEENSSSQEDKEDKKE